MDTNEVTDLKIKIGMRDAEIARLKDLLALIYELVRKEQRA